MKLEIGRNYIVSHERKGTFAVRITEQDDTWTSGVITGGKTTAMLDNNVLHAGENITFRTSFIRRATEQPEANQS